MGVVAGEVKETHPTSPSPSHSDSHSSYSSHEPPTRATRLKSHSSAIGCQHWNQLPVSRYQSNIPAGQPEFSCLEITPDMGVFVE